MQNRCLVFSHSIKYKQIQRQNSSIDDTFQTNLLIQLKIYLFVVCKNWNVLGIKTFELVYKKDISFESN